MKPMPSERKLYLLRIFITLCIAAVILGLGYLFLSGIQYWMPDYKDKMVYMEEETVQKQPLYWSREEEITIYPWVQYKQELLTPLTDEDKAFLQQAQIPDLLYSAVGSAEKTDVLSYFQKVTLNNVPAYFLKDFTCTGYAYGQTDLFSVQGQSNFTWSEPGSYTVQCAVDQNGEILYLHMLNNEAAQNESSRSEVEEAYSRFADSTVGQNQINAAAEALYRLFINCNQGRAAKILERFLETNRDAYDAVIQEREILLIYTLDSGYRVILIYNVSMGQIAGISLENLSV